MTQSDTQPASGPPLPPPKERRRLREAKSLAETQLAKTLGVTPATIRSWETGRTNPQGHRREAYAKLLAAFAAERSRTPASPKPAVSERQAADPPVDEKRVSDEPGPERRFADRPGPEEQVADEPGPEEQVADEPAEQEGATSASAPATSEPAPVPEPVPMPVDPDPVPVPMPVDPDPVPEPVRAGVAAPLPPEPSGAALRQPYWDPVPVGPEASLLAPPAGPTPAEAFDTLYAYAAPALVRQTYLLTGRRRLSHESVERAFHLAWQRWPEVAVDREPTGWVRAAAYEYAMSPWQRLRPAHRHPDEPPDDPAGRALLEALQELPPAYRRTLLLYDGLGLDLPETAAETEASTPATANRVLNARAAVVERLPHLAETTVLQDELRALADLGPTPCLMPAAAVRTSCERRAELWTRAVVMATTLIVVATALALLTSPRRYEPPLPPTRQVEGVPAPHNGPQRLSVEQTKLRDKLRAEPAAGPQRLLPGLG
ncbi:sigma factor-like helix-turn-helix DNA-binding protein [Streptomyces sp. NPDC018833]|uniref:sigma factor-like helix-turn-helix DNA-binding protein n=1 Tax=Streptomyces sp. NPDC018833 TaxID=3365053 RepID=UPI0037B9553C